MIFTGYSLTCQQLSQSLLMIKYLQKKKLRVIIMKEEYVFSSEDI